MSEREALERSTVALDRLTGEVERLGARLDTERRERRDEQEWMKTLARRTVAGFAVACVLFAAAGALARRPPD